MNSLATKIPLVIGNSVIDPTIEADALMASTEMFSNGSLSTADPTNGLDQRPQQSAVYELDIASIIADKWLTMILPYTIIFLLSFVGNLMVILTLGLNKRMRTVTNAFLFNLSLSDLLLGVFCMPFTLFGLMLRSWVFGALLCRIVPYLQAVSVSVSSWTLVTMSYERYYAICHPLRSREVHQTWSHTKRVIGGVWLASFLVMSPIAFLSDLQPIREGESWKCRETWPSDDHLEAFTIFLDVYLFLVPLLIMTSTYARIVATLWKTMSRQSPTNTASFKRDSYRTTNIDEQTLVTPKHRLRVEIDPCSSTSNGTATFCTGDTPPSPGQPSMVSSQDCHEMSKLSSNRRVSVSFRCNQENQRRRQQWRIIKMLFVVVLEFFICWTPLHVLNTLALYYPRFVYVDIGYNWISIFQLVAFMSSCTNPITYCFMNHNFRRSFTDLFKCAKRPSAVNVRSATEANSARFV